MVVVSIENVFYAFNIMRLMYITVNHVYWIIEFRSANGVIEECALEREIRVINKEFMGRTCPAQERGMRRGER